MSDETIWHFAREFGMVMCGYQGANEGRTGTIQHVNCPACLTLMPRELPGEVWRGSNAYKIRAVTLVEGHVVCWAWDDSHGEWRTEDEGTPSCTFTLIAWARHQRALASAWKAYHEAHVAAIESTYGIDFDCVAEAVKRLSEAKAALRDLGETL